MGRAHNMDQDLEAKQTTRLKAEDRYLGRLEKKEAKAENMVGELCRDGETVYYITTNFQKGSTREFSRQYQAVDFLIRNKYV